MRLTMRERKMVTAVENLEKQRVRLIIDICSINFVPRISAVHPSNNSASFPCVF
jgi:hypothetical protein